MSDSPSPREDGAARHDVSTPGPASSRVGDWPEAAPEAVDVARLAYDIGTRLNRVLDVSAGDRLLADMEREILAEQRLTGPSAPLRAPATLVQERLEPKVRLIERPEVATISRDEVDDRLQTPVAAVATTVAPTGSNSPTRPAVPRARTVATGSMPSGPATPSNVTPSNVTPPKATPSEAPASSASSSTPEPSDTGSPTAASSLLPPLPADRSSVSAPESTPTADTSAAPQTVGGRESTPTAPEPTTPLDEAAAPTDARSTAAVDAALQRVRQRLDHRRVATTPPAAKRVRPFGRRETRQTLVRVLVWTVVAAASAIVSVIVL